MDRLTRWFVLTNLIACFLYAHGADKYTDENRPYEFGFNIDGEQHRHEKKDENGIIMGEFGFITADGVYHVTVYATDENGNFKILSMKNIRVKPYPSAAGEREGHSLSLPASPTTAVTQPPRVQPPPPSPPPVTQVPPSRQLVSLEPPGRSCSSCSLPTTKPPPALAPASVSINNKQTPNSIPGQAYGGNIQNAPPQNFQSRGGFGQPQGTSQGFGPQGSLQRFGPQGSQNGFGPQTVSQGFGSPQGFSPQSGPQGFGPQISSQRDPQNSQGGGRPQGQFPQGDPQSGFGGGKNYPNQQSLTGPQHTPGQFGSQQAVGNERIPKQYSPQVGAQPGGNQPYSPGGGAPSFSGPNSQGPKKPILVSAQMQIVDKNTNIHERGPGEKEGLPKGLTKGDMHQLLYTFNYTVGFHGHFEEGYADGSKKGYYFVTGRNGVRTRVDYEADESGFHPKISQEVLDLLSDDVPKAETEKDEKYGLKGYEFKWLYFPEGSRR